MAVYKYQALTQEGKKVSGTQQADSDRQARFQLLERQLVPVSVKIQGGSDASGKGRLRRRLSTRVLANFTRQFAVLINSGLTVDEALLAISEQKLSGDIQKIARQIREKVLEGNSLSDAVRQQNCFGVLYETMILAGEKSGSLGNILQRLADFVEESHALVNNVRMAIAYPFILVLISVASISVLMAYVVPKIIEQFDRSKDNLPLITEVLIWISDFLSTYYLLIIGAVVLFAVSLRLLVRQPRAQFMIHRWILSVPFFSHMSVLVNFARYTRTLDILMSSGLNLTDALGISEQTVRNRVIRAELMQVNTQVKEGLGFGTALAEVTHIPPVVLYMLANGERSGELPLMFQRVAGMLETEFSAKVKMALTIFEPLLILLMGLIVLFIVMAILLPILELNNMAMF